MLKSKKNVATYRKTDVTKKAKSILSKKVW